MASVIAFVAAGITDSIAYAAIRRRPRLVRINVSNLIAAFVDSAIFISIAWGPSPAVIWQWGAKVMGGLGWALFLEWLDRRR